MKRIVNAFCRLFWKECLEEANRKELEEGKSRGSELAKRFFKFKLYQTTK